jgi:chorismate-pyruvate lyase
LTTACDNLIGKATEDTMTRLLAIVFFAAVPVTALAQVQALPDECGATGLQGLIGQSGEIARLLDFADQPVRVLPPNSIVTLDLRPDRLNIHLDEADVIIRIECG